MTSTLVLLAVVLGLLLVLEILNALFDAICEGLAADMARKEPVPIWLIVPTLLRFGLAVVAKVGMYVSLWVHELSHAGAQLLFGGRPRVVLLKNGGYAQSSPWPFGIPARIVHIVGGTLGRGVSATAPILVSSALLVALLVGITDLSWAELPRLGAAIAGDLHLGFVDDVVADTWHLFTGASWWIWPVVVGVGLLLAPGMTPSSVDYVNARVPLLAYSAAAITCTAVGTRAPGALWAVAAIAGAVGAGAALFARPDKVREAAGGYLLSTGALALAMALCAWRTSYTAVGALHAGLAVLAWALGLAAALLAGLVAVFLALSLVSLRPRTLWYTLRVVPKHLIDLVRPFSTCDRCRIHYRGKCEGCGRTPEETEAELRKAA